MFLGDIGFSRGSTDRKGTLVPNYHSDDSADFLPYFDVPQGLIGKEELAKAVWFTCGWTLQELIAPQHVTFYDQD